MTLKKILLTLFFIGIYSTYGQEELMVNAYNRKTTSLNGYWKYIVDPYENGFYNYRYEAFENQTNPSSGAFFTNTKKKSKADLIEYDFDKADSLRVPGDWNTQKTNLFYYEGTLWYKKSFDYVKTNAENKVFLYIGASNYETDVYLNGKKLGKHIGGFTPFQFEVTHLLKERQNFVVVKVDNKRKKDAVPTLNTDWWNYGGITRDVKLIETPKTYISNYTLQLSNKNTIKGRVKLNDISNNSVAITIKIPALKINKTYKTDENGIAAFEIQSKKIKYWSPKNPYLYDISIHTKDDTLNDQIGFRTIKTEGSKILLNGEDKMGILVWEEIPVYWTISWHNKTTYQNAEQQLSEVIDRDKNRASVIVWSMANETPTSDDRNTFLKNLATHTRAKDPTRLISAALEQKDYEGALNTRTIDDPFADVVDILSFNQYIGWYDGGIEKCKTIKWHISQNKPVIISEFGAGAKYGLHGAKDERWLVDFKSPRRVLPEIQDTYNRKGLISEKGEKKKAFYVLQGYYKTKK